MRFLATTLLLLLAILTPPAHGQETGDLVQALRWAVETDARGSSSSFDPVTLAAVDAGEPAVDMLRRFLTPGIDDRVRRAAAYALSSIGGETAVAILREHYGEGGIAVERSFLASSLASTGTSQDIQFLIAALEGEHFGSQWFPIEAAALALGALRAEEAVPALEATASKSSGSAASYTAQQALSWIRQGYWDVELPSATDENLAIAAVLRNGIPRTEEATHFYDPDRMKYWHRDGDTWRLEEDSLEGAPKMWLRVHVSPDSSRALVSVGMRFGIRNGKGYDYILRKSDGRWRVTCIHSTWIS